MTSPIAEQLTERFFRYLAVTSQSNAAATALPSTPGQHEMAQLLADELRRLGLAARDFAAGRYDVRALNRRLLDEALARRGPSSPRAPDAVPA